MQPVFSSSLSLSLAIVSAWLLVSCRNETDQAEVPDRRQVLTPGADGSVMVGSPEESSTFAGVDASLISLEKGFAQPPDQTKPWAFWYWLSGHVTKEGITKDLEAMKRWGISRAVIGNISRPDIERGPVEDLSDEFYEMLEYAIREADRMGMEISIFNCPGWSQTGGPWVRPEQSMRYLVSTEQRVSGPMLFEGKLPDPEMRGTERNPDPRDAIENVAVHAFPAPVADANKLSNYAPRITSNVEIENIDRLADGKLETVATFAPPDKRGDLEFDIAASEPFVARSLTIHLPRFSEQKNRTMGGAFNADGELLAENADGTFRSVCEFKYTRRSFSEATGPMPRGPVSVSFPEEKAKKFRVVFKNIRMPSPNPEKTTLAEIELSGAPRVDQFIEQQLGKMSPLIQPPWDYYLWPLQPESEKTNLYIDSSKIVNLTDRVGPDGTLKWEVPPGEWVIVRTMMRPTGVTNRPASKDGTGLEADKMSPVAMSEHYKNYVGKLVSRLPADERKAFRGFIIDSYETGPQNWTDDAHERFQGSFGYDPLPWLPVLTGRVVDSADKSARFLWDLRRFVAEEIAVTYKAFRDMGYRDGLHLWLQPYGHYGFPSEYLLLSSTADGVGGEFWIDPKHGQMEVQAAAAGGRIYGKRIISAEAFTGTPSYNFTQDPWSLKGLGDFQQTMGINHFVLHLYIHQPYERAPGMNAWFGTEFNRLNTWFEDGGVWIDYLRRSHFLLQRGNYAAEVAYFIGEDTPKMANKHDPPLPPGYLADDINADVICNRLQVKNGRFVLPDGLSYRLLVLPPLDTMRPATLAKIRDLVAAGGAVLGNPPLRSPSLQDYPKADQQLSQMAKELWGELFDIPVGVAQFGKGWVFRGVSVQDALEKLGVQPNVTGLEVTDMLWTGLEGKVFPWIHRSSPDEDIFYISNQLDDKTSVAPSFRVSGKQPELWDPVTGKHRDLPDFKDEGGRTIVPLEFNARESLFVVFRKPGKSAGGKNFPTFENVGELTKPWAVTFDMKRGGPAAPVVFDKPVDWLKRPEPEINNYSGSAIYRTEFDLPLGAEGNQIYLNLGKVSSLAQVTLNGQELGTVWCSPWRIDITSAIKAQGNKLEIKVTNTWINRLLKDRQLSEESRYTWAATDHIRNQKPQPSGLLGPVSILIKKQ